MTFDPSKHHRRSIRLKEYDYSRAGWYYVTICTKDRVCTFGNVVNDMMEYSKQSGIVKECWEGIPKQFPSVELDEFVIMPNHMHGIIILNQPTGNHAWEGDRVFQIRINEKGE